MKKRRMVSWLGALLAVSMAAAGCSGKDLGPITASEEENDVLGGEGGGISEYTEQESEIPLPDGIVVGIAQEEEETLRVYMMEEDGEKGLYSYEWFHGQWQKQEEPWADGILEMVDQGRLHVILGEDGQEYAWYIAQGEMPHIVQKTGPSSAEELDIPLFQEPYPGSDYVILPEQMAVLADGTIAMTSRLGLCTFFDRDNGNQVKKELDYADVGILNSSGNEIYGNMETLSTFNRYDWETDAMVLSLDNGGRTFSAFCQDEDKNIYACGRDGVYRLGEDQWNQIFSGDRNSLSDPSLQAVRIFESGGSFFILYKSLQNDSLTDAEAYVLKQYEKKTLTDEEAEQREENTVTVWGIEKNDTVEYALQVMRSRHPDMTFTYETAEDSDSGASTQSDWIRNLNTELTAGKGPDLIIMDGLDSGYYTEQNLLKPLDQPMLESLDLKKDIMESFRSADGNLYEIPIRFQVPMVFVTDQSLLHADSLDDLNQYVEQDPAIPLFAELTAEDAVDVGYRFFTPDLLGEDGSVQTDTLAAFLDDMYRFVSENNIVEEMQREFSYTNEEPWDTLLFKEAVMVVKNVSSLTDAQSVLDAVMQCQGGYKTVGQRFLPVGRIAVSANTAQETVAKEMIQLLLSVETQTKDFSDGFPVSNAAMEAWRGFQSDSSIMIGNEEQEISAGCATPEQIHTFLDCVESVNQKWMIPESLFEIVRQNTVDYLNGKTGKEEAIALISNTLSIYGEE